MEKNPIFCDRVRLKETPLTDYPEKDKRRLHPQATSLYSSVSSA